MDYGHAVVWIDHDEAHIIQFDPDAAEVLVLRAKHRRGHLRHKQGQIEAGHASEDNAYHHAVEEALLGTQEILVVGPANERIELQQHMQAHAKDVFDHVIGVELVDHPSSGELLKLAHKFFTAADRLGTIA